VLSGITTAYSADLSEKLKVLLPDTPVVWGGHHPSVTAEESLREVYVDIVVRGEGESTALALSEALKAGRSLDGIRGISFKTKNKIVHNPDRELIEDLDSLPWISGSLTLDNMWREQTTGQ